MRKGQRLARRTSRIRGHRREGDNDAALIAARDLADSIARTMHLYPSVLRTTPPTLTDIDKVYSHTRYMRTFHVPATNPREESVG